VVASLCRNVILTTFFLVALSAVPASRLKTDRSPFPTPVSQGWFPCAEAARVVGFSMVKAQQTSPSVNSDAGPGATVTELLVPHRQQSGKIPFYIQIHRLRLFGEIWREVLNGSEQA
jgi:hypothetical protein